MTAATLAAIAAAAAVWHAPAAVVRAVNVWPRAERANALAVAWCESRFDVHARRGQYRGLFQMGQAERARFGDGRTAAAEAKAAYLYWRIAGWRPWTCRP